MKAPLLILLCIAIAGCNLLETPSGPIREAIPIDTDTSIPNTGTADDMKSAFPETCSDGLKNETESDFDCGGSCRPCADGRTCLEIPDCASGFCEEGICSFEALKMPCKNEIRDGNETGIDCGGDCDACVLEEDRWWQAQWNKRQLITFQVEQEARDVRLLITLEASPLLSESDVRFVMNGTLLASEVDEAGSLSFWVLFPTLSPGEHKLYVYTESSGPTLSLPGSPWENSFAVYHSPDEVDVQKSLAVPHSTALTVEGLFNSATEFDGSNHVIISDGSRTLEDLFPIISISAWIKLSAGVSTWKMVASRQLSSGFGDDFAFGVRDGVLGGCTDSGCLLSIDVIPLGQWSYIAFVYDGRTLSLYRDGKLQNSKDLRRTKAPGKNDLIIGGNRNTPESSVQEHFSGIIDEVRFSTEILSPETLLLQFQSHDPDFFIFGTTQLKP